MENGELFTFTFHRPFGAQKMRHKSQFTRSYYTRLNHRIRSTYSLVALSRYERYITKLEFSPCSSEVRVLSTFHSNSNSEKIMFMVQNNCLSNSSVLLSHLSCI